MKTLPEVRSDTAAPRRLYTPPKLTPVGSVADLTLGVVGNAGEAGGSGQSVV